VWEYGINIDWAGILIERASGLKLNDYFQQHIFQPMGITHISEYSPAAKFEKTSQITNIALLFLECQICSPRMR
jgi:CubicO group peptidase (beta-lactamase class C family)